MTPEQKLEAIREELAIYKERLFGQAFDDWIMDGEDVDMWPEYEMWARQGAPVDLEKIVEILDA